MHLIVYVCVCVFIERTSSLYSCLSRSLPMLSQVSVICVHCSSFWLEMHPLALCFECSHPAVFSCPIALLVRQPVSVVGNGHNCAFTCSSSLLMRMCVPAMHCCFCHMKCSFLPFCVFVCFRIACVEKDSTIPSSQCCVWIGAVASR